MLSRGDFLMIQRGVREGKYLKDMAQELGVHPRTVRRALKRQGTGESRATVREQQAGPVQGVDRPAPFGGSVERRSDLP